MLTGRIHVHISMGQTILLPINSHSNLILAIHKHIIKGNTLGSLACITQFHMMKNWGWDKRVFYDVHVHLTGVLAQSVERPPHNREVVGSKPVRVIPKDVKRRELLLPCLAFNNKSNVDLALLSGCRAHDQLGKKNFHFRFNLIKFGVDFKRLLLNEIADC